MRVRVGVRARVRARAKPRVWVRVRAKLTRRTICVVSKSRTDWGFLRSWLGSGLG